MSEAISALARAKVNLSLEILRKRADGYHEIETILQSVDLFDRLDIKLLDSDEIRITSNDPELPTGRGNLCYQAVLKLRQASGKNIGAEIRIEKNIPVGAGLGGGSSDAAAVLLGLNEIAGLELEMEELERLAASIGSDVPFMLHGGTMFAGGRGEKLIPLTGLKRGCFLIVKPGVEISTTWAYSNYNFRLTRHRRRFNLKAVNAILARFPEVALSFKNSLEDAVCPAHPQIAEVLEELIATKPCFASMSGSGSALYAIYRSEANAAKVAERFSVRGLFTAVAGPAPRAVELFPYAAH
jgi:4-diphosphocytidyl-2-C-methyl-D-erythritol kinase